MKTLKKATAFALSLALGAVSDSVLQRRHLISELHIWAR